MSLYNFVRPFVFKIDPETAHGLTIKALKRGAVRTCKSIDEPMLHQDLFGLSFKNPVGLAAGFDKNAEVIDPILGLGFGFTEVGTVTPKPQAGNPKPRVFRDPKSESVINAMGFPNEGLDVFTQNFENSKRDGVVGINIGMNKDQASPADDYCDLIRALAPKADYLTVNISSPNTPGLRDLQKKDALLELLDAMMGARRDACGDDRPPALLVKLAPDLDDAQQAEIADALLEASVDGVILSNTTLDRPDYLPERYRDRKGGLSGQPVREKSTAIIRNFYKLTEGRLPIIGVGGVQKAAHAYEKIKAGASLVQLYTGMIYEGPEIAYHINSGLVELLKEDGFSSLKDAVGADHQQA